ncbi:hypothetical protein H0E87_002850 [Populus deltoides]|uniref:RNA helicase n=1 Tax=Populus deltoides TaxID=3696 RepID=A0A8T2ZZ67_POPDE|nr:hypothetical protein H0E87_002850 [Populus deltoides]
MKHRKVERRRLEATKLESAPFAAVSFSELGLPSPLIDRLEIGRFNVPTNVQSAAIPTILMNHDVVIQSYTGLGNTHAYVLSILSEVGPLKNKSSSGDKETRKKTDIKAVIVAASRELGMQIKEALKKNKPLIVVGTPGSIAEISAAASGNGTEPSSSIQTLLLHRKVGTLRRRVHALDAQYVIAFMNHTRQLKDVVFKLEARGMKNAELHGDLGKLGRSTILKKFKSGQERVLITNELAARGPGVPECDLVVNLDLPTDSIHYAHQAGRTGRLGREGHCGDNLRGARNVCCEETAEAAWGLYSCMRVYKGQACCH